MKRNFGRKSMNAFLTHGAILCVAGVRKLTLRTPGVNMTLGQHGVTASYAPIVTTTLSVTRIIVNSRY